MMLLTFVNCDTGERVTTEVDRHSAVERKLRIRENLRKSQSRQKCRTQQDM